MYKRKDNILTISNNQKIGQIQLAIYYTHTYQVSKTFWDGKLTFDFKR